jgi:glycosyltransferase involved in cell wall biosynthesis
MLQGETIGMKLVIITGHYPSEQGEEFLPDELRIAKEYFSDIVIITTAKGRDNHRYIPENCSVIHPRRSRIEAKYFIPALLSLISKRTFKEISFARYQMGETNIIECIRQIFTCYYISNVILSALEKFSSDIHNKIFYSYWLFSSAFALVEFKKQYPNICCISRAHGGDCFIDRGYQAFRREIAASIDEIFSISEAGKRNLETRLFPLMHSQVSHVTVSRLGVIKPDTAFNPPSADTVFYVVSCSGVIPLKRLDLLVEALTKIQGMQIKWTHFGDGEIMGQIRQLAHVKLDGSNNVSYQFMGNQPKERILNFYRTEHIDLFINCSDNEGIPVSIMEAFSYGIPAVARDVGGNSEIVNDVNGYLLSADSTADKIAASIRCFAHLSQEDKSKKSAAAYQTYRELYDAERNYRSFYSYLLDRFGER